MGIEQRQNLGRGEPKKPNSPEKPEESDESLDISPGDLKLLQSISEIYRAPKPEPVSPKVAEAIRKEGEELGDPFDSNSGDS